MDLLLPEDAEQQINVIETFSVLLYLYIMEILSNKNER